MKLTHRVDRYALDVDRGAIVAGPLVRLACARHLKDRHAAAKKSGHPHKITFSEKHADHTIEFFEGVLRLGDTLDANRDPVPFLLTPANTFIVGSLFGWRNAHGFRRFREAYVEMGKSNGKSPLAAGIGLYGLVMDEEQAAEIYSVATGIDQARILWRDAERIVQSSPDLQAMVYQSADNLSYSATYSWFRPWSKEKRGKSGPRPHMLLFDELHEYGDAVIVHKGRAGVKRRDQPLALEITNSGFDRTSICWAHHEHSRKILEGIIDDPQWFAYVCGLDPCEEHRQQGQPVDDCDKCDQWTDERVWPKANPNLDLIAKRDYLRRQVQNAINMPNERNDVLRYNLCVWTSARVQAWNMNKWRACGALTFTDDDLIGMPCYGGLDLGQTDDFASWCRLWVLPKFLAIKMRFWLPESALQKYPERPYEEWRRAGLLEVTPGNTTDLDLIEEAVLEDARRDGVLEIAYDKRFAQQLALHLEGAGITMTDTPQGFFLNESIRSVSKLIADVGLAHGNNAIMSWMMDNTVLRAGHNKQVRIDKDAAKEKIDGPSALVMANSRRIVRVAKPAPTYQMIILGARP